MKGLLVDGSQWMWATAGSEESMILKRQNRNYQYGRDKKMNAIQLIDVTNAVEFMDIADSSQMSSRVGEAISAYRRMASSNWDGYIYLDALKAVSLRPPHTPDFLPTYCRRSWS